MKYLIIFALLLVSSAYAEDIDCEQLVEDYIASAEAYSVAIDFTVKDRRSLSSEDKESEFNKALSSYDVALVNLISSDVQLGQCQLSESETARINKAVSRLTKRPLTFQ